MDDERYAFTVGWLVPIEGHDDDDDAAYREKTRVVIARTFAEAEKMFVNWARREEVDLGQGICHISRRWDAPVIE